MRRARAGALRRAVASYRGAPVGLWAFAAARTVIAPLDALAGETATVSGRVLSLGCGVGVVERFLVETNERIDIVGIDLDARHVDAINATRSRSPRFTLRHGDVRLLDEPPVYDAVLACDVLHHLTAADHAPVAGAIARALAPGGVCIVKDLDVAPRWKHEWNRMHDRIVAGPGPITCRSPEDMAKCFIDASLTVERCERIDRRLSPYAHYILRLRKAEW